MKKLALSLLFVAVMLASLIMINPTHASVTPTITVDPATQQFPSAQVGNTIQVNITISNVQNLWAWGIDLIIYNPTILNLTSVAEGPFLQESGQQTLFIADYTAYYSENYGYINQTNDIIDSSYTGVNGSGVLATLGFQVLSIGTSQIDFTPPNLRDSSQNPITCNAVNVTLTVGTPSNPTASPSPTPITTALPTPTLTTSPTPTTSPTQSDSTSPAASASPSPTQSPPNSAPEFPTAFVLLSLILAVTICTLLIAQNNKHRKK